MQVAILSSPFIYCTYGVSNTQRVFILLQVLRVKLYLPYILNAIVYMFIVLFT